MMLLQCRRCVHVQSTEQEDRDRAKKISVGREDCDDRAVERDKDDRGKRI
jgi:hypothetical protein